MFSLRSVLWFFGVVFLNCVLTGSSCPAGCACKKLTADCSNRGFKEIMETDLLVNVTELDLSSNDITSIQTRAFMGRKTLTKINLSRNKIANIDPGAFAGLENMLKLDLSHNELAVLSGPIFKGLKSLRFLDLSHNKLNFINRIIFTGVRKLKKLVLTSNKFITIPEGTFNSLNSLKRLDLSSNDIVCDCQLKWLVRYKNNMQRLNLKGMCQYPKELQYNKLSTMKTKTLKCGKLQLPFYIFRPKNSVVGIHGDSLTLTCGTTWIPGLKINWYKDTKLLVPGTKTAAWKITFDTDILENQVVSTLRIANLNTTDSGKYQCNVSTAVNFILGEAMLHVLTGNSKFCAAEVTRTKKGDFYWENTDVGVVAQLTCAAGRARVPSRGEAVATRECSQEGKWMAVEATTCAYDDQLTQKLYSLRQVGVNSSTVGAVSKALFNITSHAVQFRTAQDVVYAVQILRGIQAHANNNGKIAKATVGIVSNMMNVKKEFLAAAQRIDKSCSSMVFAMEKLADLDSSPLLQLTTTNIGIDIVYIFPAAFQGKTCATFFDDMSDFKSTLCNLPWKNATGFSPSRPLEASIHLPPNIFGKRSTSPMERRKMTFTVYRNSNLFPSMRNGSLQGDSTRVISSVACLQFGMPVTNISSPVAVKFRNHKESQQPLFVASWDISQQGGHGLWLNNTNCYLEQYDKFTVAHCAEVSEKTCFAIMELVQRPAVVVARSADDVFLLEPIVYIGAAVCLLLLIITLMTYVMHRQLRYNRDDAAMLMNECLAILFVVIIFVVGINRANNPLMCRAIGVLLHYFLLCCLFWVGCGGLCLCRLIRTSLQPEEFNPVLRYYMISWGIPLIICGITVAGNPENYSVENYCWLKPNPFFGAFLGPACLVIIVDIIMYYRLHSLIKRTYSLQQQEQESHEPENQEPATHINDERQHLSEALTPKCELIEQIQLLPDKTQIRAYLNGSLLVLLLIVVNFVLGLLIVRFRQPKYLNLALSCVFAVTLILLGLIVFLFHCYKHPKAGKLWAEGCGRHSCSTKKYIVDQEEAENLNVPSDKDTAKLMNGNAVKHNHTQEFAVPKIHGQPSTTHGSDIQSNVSLPSSAALTIDRPISLVEKSSDLLVEYPSPDRQSVAAASDKHSITASLSDKQSCVSAPLPLGHAQSNLREHPPGYRYSYHVPDPVEFKRVKPKRKERTHTAPIAMPERNGITSSLESSLRSRNEGKDQTLPSKLPNIEHKLHKDIPESVPSELTPSECAPSEVTPSEVAPSELSSSVREPIKLLEAPSAPFPSCASSEVSVPGVSGDNIETRLPVTGAPNVKDNAARGVKIPMDRYPYGVYGPRGTFPGNAIRAAKYPIMGYPRNAEYPRYTPMPRHQNGGLRHPNPRDQIHKMRTPNSNEQQPGGGGEGKHPPEPCEQDSPNGPVNGPRPEQFTGPSAGVPRTLERAPNGLPNEHLPRRRPRDRSSSDRPRTRRNREGGSQSRTKDPSEGETRPKPSSRFGSRTSQTSWREERQKPEPKEWVPDTVPRLNYVHIPHIADIVAKQQQEARSETTV